MIKSWIYGKLAWRKLGESGMGHLVAVLAFIVAFGVVGTWFVVAGHAQTVHPAGSVVIHSGLANLCLDDTQDSSASGSMIESFTCNGTNAQDWQAVATSGVSNVYVIKKVSSAGNVQGCLNVLNGGTLDKDNVVLGPCSSAATEYWKLKPAPGNTFNELEDNGVKGDSGFCLADPNKGPSGTALQVSPCNGQAQQNWYWSGAISVPNASSNPGSPTTGGTPTSTTISNGMIIHNARLASKCLDDRANGTKTGSVVEIFGCNKTAAQNWSFVKNPQGNSYTVRINGLCMTAANGGDENRDKVSLGTCSPSAGSDSWALYASSVKSTAAGKVVTLRDGGGYCLTDYNAASADRTQLEVYQCNGNGQQSWVVPS